eukprot:573520-Pelagomonas_calceolata.AAC.1
MSLSREHELRRADQSLMFWSNAQLSLPVRSHSLQIVAKSSACLVSSFAPLLPGRCAHALGPNFTAPFIHSDGSDLTQNVPGSQNMGQIWYRAALEEQKKANCKRRRAAVEGRGGASAPKRGKASGKGGRGQKNGGNGRGEVQEGEERNEQGASGKRGKGRGRGKGSRGRGERAANVEDLLLNSDMYETDEGADEELACGDGTELEDDDEGEAVPAARTTRSGRTVKPARQFGLDG